MNQKQYNCLILVNRPNVGGHLTPTQYQPSFINTPGPGEIISTITAHYNNL